MTRPHPVEGKAKTRKPETVLRKVRESVNVARFQLNHERVPGDNWVAVNQALLRALSRMSELRRSLGDEPVSKAYKLDTRGPGAVEHCLGCNCPVSPDCTMSCATMSDCGHRTPAAAPGTAPTPPEGK